MATLLWSCINAKSNHFVYAVNVNKVRTYSIKFELMFL